MAFPKGCLPGLPMKDNYTSTVAFHISIIAENLE